MGMRAQLISINPSIYKKSSFEELDRLIYENEIISDEEIIDIDKSWHGIHFLLSGKISEKLSIIDHFWGLFFNTKKSKNILAKTIFGSSYVDGFDSTTYLKPWEVKQVNVFLKNINKNKFFSLIDIQEIQQKGIYPFDVVSQETLDKEEVSEYLYENFTLIQNLYQNASSKNHGIIVSID